MAEHYPRFEEFAIGDNPSIPQPGDITAYGAAPGETPTAQPVSLTDYDSAAIFQPTGILPGTLLFVSVENTGKNAFVFSTQQSDDNGFTDDYDTHVVNMRYNAASVASVTVQPGGKVAVLIEAITKKTVRFKIPNCCAPAGGIPSAVAGMKPTPITPMFGRIVAVHFNGQLRRIERTGLMPNAQF